MRYFRCSMKAGILYLSWNTIRSWTKTKIRSFLRIYIVDSRSDSYFVRIAQTLNFMFEKKRPINHEQFEVPQQYSFEALKPVFIARPLRPTPCKYLRYSIDTDYCTSQLGCEFYHTWRFHPICYSWLSLILAENNLIVKEQGVPRELWVWNICMPYLEVKEIHLAYHFTVSGHIEEAWKYDIYSLVIRSPVLVLTICYNTHVKPFAPNEKTYH